MMSFHLRQRRFLVSRRVSQTLIMLLMIGANLWGWRILTGNLSFSRLLGTVPLADPFAALQMMTAGSRPTTEILLGAGITALFYALLAGRGFCGWVCPLNMVTDLAGWLRPRLAGDRAAERTWFSRAARYKILLLSLVLSALLGVAAFEWLSPIGMLQRGLVYGMGLGWTVVLAVFLFDLVWQANGFCGHLCPLGAFYALLSRFTLVRVAHDVEHCTKCELCRDVCPEQPILSLIGERSGTILAGECTNCGRCVEVCTDDALTFGFRSGYRSI